MFLFFIFNRISQILQFRRVDPTLWDSGGICPLWAWPAIPALAIPGSGKRDFAQSAKLFFFVWYDYISTAVNVLKTNCSVPIIENDGIKMYSLLSNFKSYPNIVSNPFFSYVQKNHLFVINFVIIGLASFCQFCVM